MLIVYFIALFVIGLYFHGQGWTLQFAGVYRADRTTYGKATVDVCAARDRVEMQVLFDFPVSVLKAFGRKG
ncbi:MAG: hypothetical protein GTO40_27225 [Deltaproteobacteria bacterium]|nr:hypothetical protein [Deltaproteobacteria bacterium]